METPISRKFTLGEPDEGDFLKSNWRGLKHDRNTPERRPTSKNSVVYPNLKKDSMKSEC